MPHSVTFRPGAVADLEALEDYITLRSGPERAEGYIARIEAACMRLAYFPNRGRDRGDIASNLRTIGFERRALIAFRVIGDTVEIVAILYGGRDLRPGLAER